MSLKFDDIEDYIEKDETTFNENVRVGDAKAEYISNMLARELLDEESKECYESRVPFSGLSDLNMSKYQDIVNNNACQGRKKKDFMLPFPTSLRQSERDIVNHFALGDTKYWPIGSGFQSSDYSLSHSQLEDMGIPLPDRTVKRNLRGSYTLGSLKDEYIDMAKHVSQRDDFTGNVSYLFEKSNNDHPLSDHEQNCIDTYKPVVQDVAGRVIYSYTMYLRRLAENIMHSSRKVKKNCVQMRCLGDNRIISLMNHSNLNSVESGPLCSFIIKMNKKDYDVYNKVFKLKVLISTDSADLYVFVPWRSFDLVDCSIMLKSNYYLLSFPLLFLDGLTNDMDSKLESILVLLAGIIQCRNTEVFSVLSNFRYIMPGLLNRYHNISELVLDKFPKNITSGFCDFIVYKVLEWMTCYKKSLVMHDRSRIMGNVVRMDEYDVEFRCKLPYLDFDAENFEQYLSITYLVSMTAGKTKHSRHVYLGLFNTLKEWEEKAKEYKDNLESDTFSYDEYLLGKSCDFLLDVVKPSEGEPDSLISKYLRTKGTLDDTGTGCKRLFDRTLYEMDHPIHDCTNQSLLEKYEPKPIMRMAVRDDHAGEREIFVTSLPAVCALNQIESISHSVCEQLPSEHITLGGERKVIVMQNEAQASLTSEEFGWKNYLGSEDASKWSTGDNPDIIKKIFEKISKNVNTNYRSKLVGFIDSMKNRTVQFQEGSKDYIKDTTGYSEIKLTQGWPQGFFNKLSSLKHYLCYCLAIAMFKKIYKENNQVRIKFAVHSDDSRHRFTIDPCDTGKGTLDLQYELFIKCLYWAKRRFLIRPNIKKSFYAGSVSEYLSHFQFHGSLIIPKSKFILSIFGDLTGSGYPSDVYSVMERVRTCMRYNCGMGLGKFMMNYASNYVLRLYSMLPDMRNYDPYRNTKDNLIELGGIFSVHPIYLLFLGCKAHDILNYTKNADKVSKLIYLSQDIEDTDENSPSELYNHFLPIPTAVCPEKSMIRGVRRKYNCSRLDKSDRWKTLYLEDLNLSDATTVAKSMLLSSAMSKAYSTAPEGLMYARIQQTWDRPSYRLADQYLTYWEFVRKVESSKFEPVNILSDLTRASPTLLGMIKLNNIKECDFGELSRTHVTSSQVNRINILAPGSNEYRYLKYALANLIGLDIIIPDHVDQRLLRAETDVLEKEVTYIPGVSDTMSKENVPMLFKLLNLRNSKPSYLHLNKHIVDPNTLDLYELVSIILKNYGPSITGKVSLGKMSSITVGDKTFRPENISYKRNQLDEVHSLAKIISLMKSNLSDEEYKAKRNKVEVAGKDPVTLIQTHPFKANDVSYYIDYIFLCQEFDIPVDFECDIDEDIVEEPDGSMYFILKSGSNYLKSTLDGIILNDPIDNNRELPALIALGYLRHYQLWLDDKNDWSIPEMPKELVTVCPHLYFNYESGNKLKPSLCYREGKICFNTGFFNHYFSKLTVKRMTEDDLYMGGNTISLKDEFKPDLSFTELTVQSKFGNEEIKLGIGVSWQGLNVSAVGELAKFNIGVTVPSFIINGDDAKKMIETRYYASDDIMLTRKNMSIPDVSRHKRHNPHLTMSDLRKSDFDRLRHICYVLSGQASPSPTTKFKSLYYREEVESNRSVFSYFADSQLFSSQIKNILSYKAYILLCQNLIPIRCKMKHEKTLSKIDRLISEKFIPNLPDMRASKYNLVELILHISALIGISLDVSRPEEGSLTGDEYLEFVSYASYSGCTANVWSKMFDLYLSDDVKYDDDLLE